MALLWPRSNPSFSFSSCRSLSLLNISAFGPGKAFENSPAQERYVPLLFKGGNEGRFLWGPGSADLGSSYSLPVLLHFLLNNY